MTREGFTSQLDYFLRDPFHGEEVTLSQKPGEARMQQNHAWTTLSCVLNFYFPYGKQEEGCLLPGGGFGYR